MIINQTELLPRNVRLDLLMIRLASMNQILDPWVYILLRRELLWKVISCFKTLCRIRQNPDLIPQKSQYDIENDTCCIFCFHCLCDPPVKRPRSGSLYSSMYESEHRRSTITSSTPTMVRRGSELDRNFYLLLKHAPPPYSNGRLVTPP